MNEKELDALSNENPALASLYYAMCKNVRLLEDHRLDGARVDELISHYFAKYLDNKIDEDSLFKYLCDAFVRIVTTAGHGANEARELLELYCFS